MREINDLCTIDFIKVIGGLFGHFIKRKVNLNLLFKHSLEKVLILFSVFLRVINDQAFEVVDETLNGCDAEVQNNYEVESFGNERNAIVGILEIKLDPFNG